MGKIRRKKCHAAVDFRPDGEEKILKANGGRDAGRAQATSRLRKTRKWTHRWGYTGFISFEAQDRISTDRVNTPGSITLHHGWFGQWRDFEYGEFVCRWKWNGRSELVEWVKGS